MLGRSLTVLLGLTAARAAPAQTTLSDPMVGQARLTFNKGGSFKIASFHDLHFGEAENTLWGPQQDVNSVRVMNNVLTAEKPDFVVFNGDLITGENTFKENSTHYLEQVLAPTVQRKIPFATTYGNHDNDVNITHAALLARERVLYPKLSYTHLTAGSTTTGPGTYYIPVFKSASSSKPALLLWFFDSRAGKAYGTGTELEDWVDAQAVSWAKSTVAEMRSAWRHLPPSLAFVHIPTNTSRVYQDTIITPENGDDSSEQDPDAPSLRFPGLNDDQPLAAQDSENYYHPSYQGSDQPFITFLEKELASRTGGDGGLFAVVSGHDHGDAWCAKGPSVSNITVCFGKHSGYGGYGSWARGARVFEVQLGSAVMPTWVRMENGSVIDQVTLGPDFGN